MKSKRKSRRKLGRDSPLRTEAGGYVEHYAETKVNYLVLISPISAGAGLQPEPAIVFHGDIPLIFVALWLCVRKQKTALTVRSVEHNETTRSEGKCI